MLIWWYVLLCHVTVFCTKGILLTGFYILICIYITNFLILIFLTLFLVIILWKALIR